MVALVALLSGCDVLLLAYWLLVAREERRLRAKGIVDAAEPAPTRGAKKTVTRVVVRRHEEPPLPWPFSYLDTLQQQAGEHEGLLRLLLTAALASAGLTLIAWLLVGQPVIVVGAAASGLLVPGMLLRRKADRRMALIEEQVSSACQFLIQALYGGAPPETALRDTARDAAAPLGEELRTVIRDVDSGEPLDMALGRLPGRVPGAPSVRMLVASLQIALEMGANLGDHLTNLAELIRQRRTAEARVRSTVASARMQGKILFFAPLLAYVWMHLQAPMTLKKFQTPHGQLELLGMAVWLIIGYVVTQGILRNAFGEVL